MIEQGKISSFQMGVLLFPTVIASAILSIPSSTAIFALNDLWISPIIASSVGFLAILIAYRLHNLYPKQTIIEYSEQILGKVFGKMLGWIFLLNLFFTNGLSIRQYTELSIGAFLSQTPMSVVTAGLVLVCSFAVRGGLEVVARAALLLLPIYLVSLILIIILLSPEFEVHNILPVMENGFWPVIKGAAVPESMFTLFILVAYLLPYLSDEKKGRKWTVISVVFVAVTLMITNLAVLFVFGATTSNYVYPVLSAAKYISIADFLEHLESIVIAVWVAGTFIKISVQYYVTVLATAQLLKLSDYRYIVLPVGLLNILWAFWGIENFSEMTNFLGTILPIYTFWINIVLPLFLLLIAVVRKRMKQSKVSSGA